MRKGRYERRRCSTDIRPIAARGAGDHRDRHRHHRLATETPAGRSRRRRRLHRMTLYTLAVLRRDFFASYVQSGFPARPAVRAINCGPYFKYSGALARGLARFDRFRVAQRDGPLPVASLVSDDRILDASVFH
jgi:hypothetical protein